MKLKNFLAVFSAVVLASLVSVSCQPKDDGPEEPTLFLSTQALTLNNQAQNPTEAQVQVTTNQPKWNVSTNATWLTATRKGEGIVVGAEANTLGKDRKAEVVVYAGGLVEKIAVTQSASKIFLNLSSEMVEAPVGGGQFLVAVETNAEKWEMEADEAGWFKATIAGGFVKIDVQPNDTDKVREAKLYVKVGAEMKAIKVQQMTNATYFPILNDGMSINQRAKKEAANGSSVIRLNAPGQGFFGPQNGNLTVMPKANGFVSASYNIPYGNPNIWEKIVIIAETWENVAEGEFIEALKREGFARMDDMSEETKIVYQNSEKRLRANIVKEVQKDKTIMYGVVFERYYIQDKDYPTFTKFPYLLKDFLEKEDKKVEEVGAFLTNLGYKKDFSKPNEKNPDEVELEVFGKVGEVGKEEPKDVLTGYHMTGEPDLEPALLQSLSEFIQYFTQDKINIAMWLRPNGTYEPTKEFRALMDKEGFNAKYIESGDKYYFVSKEDYVVMLRATKFSDLNEGEFTLVLGFWYKKGASKPTASLLSEYYYGTDKKQVEVKLNAKMAEIEKTKASKTQSVFERISLK